MLLCSTTAVHVVLRECLVQIMAANKSLSRFCSFCVPCASGGHLNPAVTLTMAVIGRLPWFLVPIFMIAQYLGAFVGAACVYSVYIGITYNMVVAVSFKLLVFQLLLSYSYFLYFSYCYS